MKSVNLLLSMGLKLLTNLSCKRQCQVLRDMKPIISSRILLLMITVIQWIRVKWERIWRVIFLWSPMSTSIETLRRRTSKTLPAMPNPNSSTTMLKAIQAWNMQLDETPLLATLLQFFLTSCQMSTSHPIIKYWEITKIRTHMMPKLPNITNICDPLADLRTKCTNIKNQFSQVVTINENHLLKRTAASNPYNQQ